MKKLFYPAIFHIAEEGGYWVSFPDIPECLTDGDTYEETFSMAIDALDLALSDKIKNHIQLPIPSDISQANDGIVVMIPYNFN